MTGRWTTTERRDAPTKRRGSDVGSVLGVYYQTLTGVGPEAGSSTVEGTAETGCWATRQGLLYVLDSATYSRYTVLSLVSEPN
ncbi:hypothetical protein GLOTRDRAFT_134601 [Gloeophyllum trabeum ATCC 11539]|uniref:Uncharacterized protein n=1 Tax=Gloeophyllum trabeum (strain ATCC 11539 / FP-39264 / Madison 617) TaxID=670483 RepID=S7RBL8_GLOTA|nr:uncharacterized protein GLOTRDRAFT_134601 [Gloeophyllum trabeum ATCC 11539]EPQ49794.1 hypothetical protein GLOTRDRAFT_134601 [Gloeophyllum trabeum ATCC 11539]